MSRDLQQRQERDANNTGGADIDVDAEHEPEVARRASNASLRREVQKKGPDGMDEQQVHAAAARGTATGASKLPHHDKIQAAFGDHDISKIRAHVDPASTGAMGAEAYASGDHVVFNRQPDLHTAAHEAAHVVQQAKGVNLKGGVGAAGDAYEREADEVADHVVAGKSAAHLLGPAGGGGAGSQAVQRKPAEKADPKAAHDASDRKSYDSVRSALVHLAKELHTWGPKLDAATSASSSTDAGAGPAMNTINAIYEAALNDATRVGELISVADKSERSTLSPEVKQVQGAYARFWPHIRKAENFMRDHHAPIDATAIQKEIDGYTARIGFEGQKLEPNTNAPEGDDKALSKSMIDNQLAGIDAAIASVKAGNANDAARITLHLRYLDGIAKEHPAELKAHKAQLKTFLKKIDEVRKDNPALADRLSEAHNHLASMLH
jgi:hypothetical protein